MTLVIPWQNLELPRCEAKASGGMLGGRKRPPTTPASLTLET